ncbi:MAG TPA: hypothetical protein VGL56_13610 [Fimbriimonadaceae bacterium]
MSLNLPSSVERELKAYALAENISVAEAAAKLIRNGLKAKRQKAGNEVTEAELETLRQNVPIFAFFERLPDSVIDGMEAASKQIRAERFSPRG